VSLLSRLVALEAATPPGACRTCHAWGWRVLSPDGEPEEPWRTPSPPLPEQCPDCGREPSTIRRCYADTPGRFDEGAINVTIDLARDRERQP
jgi:hypothetical protein